VNAVKCAQCGKAVDVGTAERGRDVHCPHCGQLVSTADGADSSDDATFEDKDETLSPTPSSEVVVFSFLDPPEFPNELGRLGDYRVVRLLGQGGMGVVFEAIDTQLMRTVALKVMKPDIAKDAQARKRFMREARATASVRSDHIVVIHHVGEENQLPFFAMEFLRGESLEKWIEHYGRPTLVETLRIGIEIASGLAAAHERGLIHRDIKPANIWLEDTASPTGVSENPTLAPHRPRRRVKILDFGLARTVRDRANLTHSGMVIGTPAYMAPEQAEGGAVDARSDLFSLGCVLYELATGARPFGGASTMAILMAVALKPPLPPLELNPALPPALSDLLLQLLAKKPADRPASAQMVANTLDTILSESGGFMQTPPSGLSRLPRRADTMTVPIALQPRSYRWIIVTVLGIALAAGLASWLIFAFLSAPEPELLIGMSGPFSGLSKELGSEMARGIEVYFRHINDQGGVHGRKLKLVPLDDGYEPDRALANMKELHEERKVFAVLGNIGTPTAVETVPYAVKNKMLFFGAFTGAPLLRKVPPDRYVFNYRASYEEETAKIVEYLVDIRENRLRPEQIAVFDQDDRYGDAGFAGVVKVMRDRYQRDKSKIVRVRYDRNTIHVNDAVETIRKHPELRAVVMVATYEPAGEFIRRLKDVRPDLIFANVSFVGSEALAEYLLKHGKKYVDGVIVTQVVPPTESKASIVLKYHELLNFYFPEARPSFASLEGYIASALFVEGLQRVGPNPTTEKLIDTLETIRDLDIGTGALLSFSKSEHQASHKVWGTILDREGKFKVLELH
jgi:eukaryotic-like serine/threonine-protein kinase